MLHHCTGLAQFLGLFRTTTSGFFHHSSSWEGASFRQIPCELLGFKVKDQSQILFHLAPRNSLLCHYFVIPHFPQVSIQEFFTDQNITCSFQPVWLPKATNSATWIFILSVKPPLILHAYNIFQAPASTSKSLLSSIQRLPFFFFFPPHSSLGTTRKFCFSTYVQQFFNKIFCRHWDSSLSFGLEGEMKQRQRIY